MDPSQTITDVLTSLGYGEYVRLALAIIGLFSAIAVVWPPTWPGAAVIHKLALLVGRAKPATPASK